MSYAGLRIGEAAAMTRDCIGSDYIEIRATVYEPNRGQPMLTPPKTSGSETEVEIPSSLRRMLLEHAVRYGVSSGPMACSSPQPWRHSEAPQLAAAQWADACRGAGVDFKPHDLRHFYCSLLIQQGASVERVCRPARHTNPRITWETYTHEFKRAKGHISPETAVLDRLIGG